MAIVIKISLVDCSAAVQHAVSSETFELSSRPYLSSTKTSIISEDFEALKALRAVSATERFTQNRKMIVDLLEIRVFDLVKKKTSHDFTDLKLY